MRYSDYISFYKSLCKKLHRRYPVRKELISEAVSESIAKNLCLVEWEKCTVIGEESYQKILEDARNYLRRILKKENRFVSIDGEKAPIEIDTAILPFEDEMLKRLLIERVTASIPTPYKEMVTLYFLGYKYSDIADKLGVNISTVKKRFERLKKYLKSHW